MTALTEEQATAHLERLRWPQGAQCPFCQLHQVTKLNGKRQGFYQCNRCRKQFTVRVGTIFERSHIPLRTWLLAVQMLCASKKGMSALQLSRMLGITYKSSWFMCHRIRHAMKGKLPGLLTGVLEADETYVGGKAENMHSKRGRGAYKKTPVLAIIQREGSIRTEVLKSVSAKNLREALQRHAHQDSTLMTDEFRSYRAMDEYFAAHHRVNHSRRQYVKGKAHVNTAESFFSLLKRGIYGSFHHVSKEHLHRYCDEFAFRWDMRKVSDVERTEAALRLVEGKRLMYATLTHGAEEESTQN